MTLASTHKHHIAVIPGDGIGGEVTEAALPAIALAAQRHGVDLEFIHYDLGAEKYLAEGVTLPDATFAALRDEHDAILLGALGDPRVPGQIHAREILLGLRFRLDLYINLRPARLLHPDLCPLKGKGLADLDLVLFRENTECVYGGMGGFFKQGTPDEVAISEMVATRKGVERILRAAYEYARAHGKTRVCMADKSNAIVHAHGLWQRVYAEVREQYPDIESRHLYADVVAMELVRAPEQFEIIVTSNLLGDVLSDLGAQLVGGLGLAASANLHPGRTGLFEPVHGSAPPLAGKDVANPLAMIATGGLMLEALGHKAAGRELETAIRLAIERGKVTADLSGTLGTRAAGDAVAEILAHL